MKFKLFPSNLYTSFIDVQTYAVLSSILDCEPIFIEIFKLFLHSIPSLFEGEYRRNTDTNETINLWRIFSFYVFFRQTEMMVISSHGENTEL